MNRHGQIPMNGASDPAYGGKANSFSIKKKMLRYPNQNQRKPKNKKNYICRLVDVLFWKDPLNAYSKTKKQNRNRCIAHQFTC